jgi:hypothetical protein
MKINEVIQNEVPRTCQIQQEAMFQGQQVQILRPTNKIAQVSTKPIPDQLKHRLVQSRLAKQMMRHSNIVKPSSDDLRIARNRADTELKKADLDFKKRSEAEQRQQERQKHSSSVQADRHIEHAKKPLKGACCRS